MLLGLPGISRAADPQSGACPGRAGPAAFSQAPPTRQHTISPTPNGPPRAGADAPRAGGAPLDDDSVGVATDPVQIHYAAEVNNYPLMVAVISLAWWGVERNRWPVVAAAGALGVWAHLLAGVAIALAKQAKVLLLDEPTSGLDPKASNEFSQLLLQLKANTLHSRCSKTVSSMLRNAAKESTALAEQRPNAVLLTLAPWV